MALVINLVAYVRHGSRTPWRQGGVSTSLGVIGSGDVGQTRPLGVAKKGHAVTLGARTPAKLAEWAAAHPEVRSGDFGDAADAKDVATALLAEVGWDAQDVGGVAMGGLIEALCQRWCAPGSLKNDGFHAFKVLREPAHVMARLRPHSVPRARVAPCRGLLAFRAR